MKISVCMATFNGQAYIKEQIDSILIQLKSTDELIISDDGSTDSTMQIISAYNDDRIKIFKNHFKSAVKNFEFALTQASGDYIFLSDQDDIWEPDKVEATLAYLNTGYDLVLCDAVIFASGSNEVIQSSFFKFNNSRPGALNNILKNSFIGCCMAFSSKVKKRALPFPANIPMHDSWIGLIGTLFYKTIFIKQQLVRYRKHDTNLSATSTGISNYSLMDKLKFRFFLVKGMIITYLK